MNRKACGDFFNIKNIRKRQIQILKWKKPKKNNQETNDRKERPLLSSNNFHNKKQHENKHNLPPMIILFIVERSIVVTVCLHFERWKNKNAGGRNVCFK